MNAVAQTALCLLVAWLCSRRWTDEDRTARFVSPDPAVGAKRLVTVKVYTNGGGGGPLALEVHRTGDLRYRTGVESWLRLVQAPALGPPTDGQEHWRPGQLRWFDASLREVASFRALGHGVTYFVVPRGQTPFRPALAVGDRLPLRALGASVPPLVIETLSVRPALFAVADFLSAAECAHLVQLAEQRLQPSLTYEADGSLRPTPGTRTSELGWLTPGESPILGAIQQRVQRLLGVPNTTLYESFQVVRYLPGQFYHAHHDYFPDTARRQMPDPRTQRIATVLVYLNEVEGTAADGGGHTVFPYAGDDRSYSWPSSWVDHVAMDYTDCTRGLRVAPHRGKALLFYNVLPRDNALNPVGDESTLHMGCAPVRSVKWALNIWLRNV